MTALRFKVYRHGSTKLAASCRHAEEAAAVVGMSGGVVKVDGRIVFRQGREVGNELDEVDASESWEGAARVMEERARLHQFERYERLTGRRHAQDPRGHE